jgi:hypothetical protein
MLVALLEVSLRRSNKFLDGLKLSVPTHPLRDPRSGRCPEPSCIGRRAAALAAAR